MTRKTVVDGSDTHCEWSITENMRPGTWEWGISAHDIAIDNNHLWMPEIIGGSNQIIHVSPEGKISGQTQIVIPDQNLDPAQIISASKNDLEDQGGVIGKNLRINTTLAKQLALYVVLYSPIQMLADFIENYQGHPALQFIKDVPTDWDSTLVLNGEIGEYLTVARKDRNSQDWFLGSITNERSRTFEIDLSILDPNVEYIY